MADDIEVLEEYGIPVRKLANMIRTVRALAGGALEGLAGVVKPGPRTGNGRRRGRPPGSGRKPGRPAGSAPTGASGTPGKRGRKTGWNPAKEELAKMRNDGMTAKEIAQKAGVSMGTVNL